VPSPAGSNLVRASLKVYNPPTGSGTTPGGQMDEIKFQFNPNQLSLSKSASWVRNTAKTARAAATPEFSGAEPRRLTLELFLDSSAKQDTKVQKAVDRLLKCCVPTAQSIAADRPSPPWVRFQWGSFGTVLFTAYVSQVDVTYSLFSSKGVPLRAACSVTLEEIGGDTSGQNPTSGAREVHRVHRVVTGDSLELLAWREYGEAGAWRLIAEANHIDNPLRLRPGTELLLPARDDAALAEA
jgi:nucleoid-associated protein YgaU